ncbi:MAG: carbohydrate-binding domain-containing protein [Caldilineae bacterium]|nr:carbohydrate-binding domain-containing protein [Anaerolineae bacterium]MCB9154851.1 carbohydrate-binding domain-containing protein [Caldilineae bacterium]
MATPTSSPGYTLITLGTPITVSGSGAVVSGNTVTIVDGGAYRVVGTLADGMIEVDTAGTVELTLAGMALTHAAGPAIDVSNAESVSLVLAAGTTNTLVDGADYTGYEAKGTLFSNDTLEISGSGALQVTGHYKHAIVSDDDLIIHGGVITLAATTDGLHANDDISVYGGTIHVVQAHDALESEGTLSIYDGALNLAPEDDGIIAEDTLTIHGGTIYVSTGTEGIESKNNIVINGGSITITVSDDGLNATNDITVNGGQIYANSTAGDAVDSNGTLHFTGGLTVALGANVPEGGLDCDNCQIVFNGGTVVGAGGRNSTPSSNSAQRVVVMSSRPVGTAIRFLRDDGVDAFVFRVTKTYQSMIYTAPELLPNRTYTAYTGGTISGGTDFYGLYTGATYTGGSVWTTFNTNAVVTTIGGPPGP